MTAHMGYLIVTAETPGGDLDAIVNLLGSEPAHAWLEDDFRAAGMELREGMASEEVVRLVREAVGLVDEDRGRDVVVWPRGRVFNDAADLRWERIAPGQVQMVAIADAALPSSMEKGCLDLAAPTPDEHLFLWGHPAGADWAEDRVPGLARPEIYPRSWRGPAAVIRVRIYEAAPPAGKPPTEMTRTVTRYLRCDGCHTLTETPDTGEQ